MKWQLQIYKDNKPSGAPLDLEGCIDLGRQDTAYEKERTLAADALPLKYPLRPGVERVVMALSTEKEMLRHFELEVAANGKVRCKNLSRNVAIQIVNGGHVAPETTHEGKVPAEFRLDKWTFRAQTPFESGPGESDLFQSLVRPSVAPGSRFHGQSVMASMAQSLNANDKMERADVIGMLQTAMEVLRDVASSGDDFLSRAATAVVEHVNMDGCRVLLYDGSKWETTATATRPGASKGPWKPSNTLLNEVLKKKATQYPQSRANTSLAGITAVIAAPIINSRGEVIGALYGDRGGGFHAGRPAMPIGEVEAMLTDMFAYSVAAGFARMEQEKKAISAKVQLEAVMGPKLARHVSEHPESLKGKDAQVSILFCDIRKFSTNSKHLGPEGTVEWIGKVMSRLTDCVQEQEGVVVDFIGDEMMAMWGAPVEQPDHAQRACKAALNMLEHLPALNAEWNARLKEPMEFGVGVNSGVAHVGNVGTDAKIKYGALGNTTNLASRVQGSTKYLKTRLLITKATQQQLDASFATRRLARVEVVNIPDPVELFELAAAAKPIWTPLQMEYEKALQHFEAREFREAARSLSNVLAQHQDDGPALVLLSRAVSYMVQPPDLEDSRFDVMKLAGK